MITDKAFVASSKQKKDKEEETNRTVGTTVLCLHPVVDRQKGKQRNGWNYRFSFIPSERQTKIKSV